MDIGSITAAFSVPPEELKVPPAGKTQSCHHISFTPREHWRRNKGPRAIPVSSNLMQKARACMSSCCENSKVAAFLYSKTVYSKSKTPLENTSFLLITVCSEQCCSLLSPLPREVEVGGGLKMGRAPGRVPVGPVSASLWCQPCLLLDLKCCLLMSSLILLLPPTCSPQSHGDTGLCPGMLAAVGLLGTCTQVDGVKVDFVEMYLTAFVLCLMLCCVHV